MELIIAKPWRTGQDAPTPPDPEALGEALAPLWALGPWREELRQLLVLLADRAVPLPLGKPEHHDRRLGHRAALHPP
jgi:hypothetical protein